MGSRTAVLMFVQGETRNAAGEREGDPACFGFVATGRHYRVPFRELVQPRSPNARPRAVSTIHGLPGQDAKLEFCDGGRRSRLSSFAVDYDLSPFIVEGDGMPVPRPERSSVDYVDAPPPAVVHSDSEGPEAKVIRVDEILGWPVQVVRAPSGSELPLLSHRELAKRLGYAHHHDVLEIAKSALGEGWRYLAARQESPSGGRPSTTWLFDRRQALEITVMARTPSASKVRGLVLDVFEAWVDGRLPSPSKAAPTGDHWAAISALAGGTLELRSEIGAVRTEVRELATHAVQIAEEARALAREASVVNEMVRGTPPGASSATPDGAWSAKPPDGFKSMRGLARDFALPSDGAGAGFVGRVARALGVYDDPESVSFQDVVIGGRARRQHVTYGPKAIEQLAPALRHAHAKMRAHGYHVIHGVLQPHREGVVRSKGFVLGEMLAAAVAGAAGVRPAPGAQATIPGVDERKAS